MSKALIYYGEIAAKNGDAIRVEIHKEGFTGTAQELTFPASNPVQIEWPEKDKTGSCLSSNATLKIESMSDRQFLSDLYTVDAGSVLMKVFINSSLYWCGSLDTEQYNEPYSRLQNYDVTLTFQDFGLLERRKYDVSEGQKSVKDLVEYLIDSAGLGIDKEWKVSIQSVDDGDECLESAYVRNANWYDEEGEPKTKLEVLDDVMSAFSLRCKQKAGKVYIYDLNTMYSETATQIQWDGDDAQLEVDKVYNDIEVTFSPYQNDVIIEDKVDFDQKDYTSYKVIMDDQPNSEDNLKAFVNAGGGDSYNNGWAWPQTSQYGGSYVFKNRDGFDLQLTSTKPSSVEIDAEKYFRVYNRYNGDNSQGVAFTVNGFDLKKNASTGNPVWTRQPLSALAMPSITSLTVSSRRKYAPKINLYGDRQYYMRLNVQMLFSDQPNPFASMQYDVTSLLSTIAHLYIPYELKLEGDDGVTYIWANASSTYNKDDGTTNVNRWYAEGSQSPVLIDGYQAVMHYRGGDITTGLSSGWQSNKGVMGRSQQVIPSVDEQRGDGEYITLPPVGGYLTLSFRPEAYAYDKDGNIMNGGVSTFEQYYFGQYIGWWLMKSITLDIVDEYGNELEEDDVVTKAELIPAAKEKLDIDTTLDVSDSIISLAKGLIVDEDVEPYCMFKRAGATGTLANLMCNTIYSQYASRHLILSGTTKILKDFGIYSEQSTDGRFILLSEIQSLRESESNVSIVQFNPDKYVQSGATYDDVDQSEGDVTPTTPTTPTTQTYQDSITLDSVGYWSANTVGNQLPSGPVTTNTSFKCTSSKIACQAGDTLTITGRVSGTAVRLWVFVDSSGVILSTSDQAANVSNLVVTAPVNAAYFVISINKSYAFSCVHTYTR